MKIQIATAGVILSDADSRWWNSMNPKQQKKYIKLHPNSKYAKALRKTQEMGGSVKKRIARLNADQRKMFGRGDHKPGSKERRKFGEFMKDKANGVVTALKHEVEEWKDAGSAVKKIFTGGKPTEHEIHALKTVAIHAAMVVVPMAITGGLSGGIGSAAKGIGLHLLEHTALIRGAQVAVFAQDYSNMSEEEALEELIKQMGDAMAEANIPLEKWVEACEGVT